MKHFSKKNALLLAFCLCCLGAVVLAVIFAVTLSSGQAVSAALIAVQICLLLGAFFCGIPAFSRAASPPPPDSSPLSNSDFASRMSHEVRTPMNAIVGMCRMAKDTDDLEKIHFYVDNISISTTHLLALINDILDLSKIEAGQVVIRETPMQLDHEIEEICKSVQSALEAKHHYFRLDLANGLPKYILCDGPHLQKVVVNLLSNAINFTPYAGEIALSVRPLATQDGSVQLEWRITDNGIGFDTDSLETLFTPFRAGDDRQTLGTGLGLPIAQRLVQAMGGQLQADSTLGKGSTFYFSLWTRIAQNAPASASFDPLLLRSATPLNLTGKTVLVAEDSEINRLIAENIFEGFGATVEAAGSGQEALQKYLAAPTRYNLILMDIQMPVMDGYEATRQIRASGTSTATTIPIIALTASVYPKDVEAALAAGMNAHIGKPFAVQQVEDSVRSVLSL